MASGFLLTKLSEEVHDIVKLEIIDYAAESDGSKYYGGQIEYKAFLSHHFVYYHD